MTTRDEKRRAAYHRMAEGLRGLERALHGPHQGKDAVPEAWHEIAQGSGPGAKERLTLWVEADVLRFFRQMGKGHTTRMAEVLAAFMHARLAGVVKGPEAVDYSRPLPTPEEEAAQAAKDERWAALEAQYLKMKARREGRGE